MKQRHASSERFALPRLAAALLALSMVAPGMPGPALARDSLGMYGDWGAFRDPGVPRCYAIAMARPSTLRRDYQPYATIGTWPARGVRNQVHFRLSRKMAADSRIRLNIAGKRYELTGGGGDAWASDAQANAAIITDMRAHDTMTVSATGADGRRFSNTWALNGAASAIDAALLGCARQ